MEKEQEQIDLRDLLDKQLVQSFISTYSPWEDLRTADEILSDGQLRDMLNAWPMFGQPDLLPYYKKELYLQGFTSRIDPSTSCACIAVRRADARVNSDGSTSSPTK